MEIEEVTAASMSPLTGTDFKLADHDVTLTLTLVDEVPGATDERIESFALVFEGPTDVHLEQGSWDLVMTDGEPISLFLVPIGQRDSGLMGYESTFSRLV